MTSLFRTTSVRLGLRIGQLSSGSVTSLLFSASATSLRLSVKSSIVPRAGIGYAVSATSGLDVLNPKRGVVFYLLYQSCLVIDSAIVHDLGITVSLAQLTLSRRLGLFALLLLIEAW